MNIRNLFVVDSFYKHICFIKLCFSSILHFPFSLFSSIIYFTFRNIHITVIKTFARNTTSMSLKKNPLVRPRIASKKTRLSVLVYIFLSCLFFSKPKLIILAAFSIFLSNLTIFRQTILIIHQNLICVSFYIFLFFLSFNPFHQLSFTPWHFC